MSDELKEDVVKFAKEALVEFDVERDVAGHMKRQMDKTHGNSWNVIVGIRYSPQLSAGG